MLSLETAKKLKDANFPWDWQEGDVFCILNSPQTGILNCGNERTVRGFGLQAERWEDVCFTPRLDQLLAWIEGQGYKWDLHTFDGYYEIQITEWVDWRKTDEQIVKHGIIEEAAAQAVLWILSQEKAR